MRSAFWAGFRRTLPFQSGVIPFGVLYATIASAAGLPWWMTLLFSIIVYGGSSQLVFLDLLRHLGSPFQAVLGSNIVNARHLIYSAGVSHEFASLPARWRFLLAYMLSDQLYAVIESDRPKTATMNTREKSWYFFGAGACTWVFWMLANIVGVGFGHVVPASWNLSFSIPLIFLPLVLGVTKNRFAVLTIVLTILLVVLLHRVPFGLGVFAAILLASTAGALMWRAKGKS